MIFATLWVEKHLLSAVVQPKTYKAVCVGCLQIQKSSTLVTLSLKPDMMDSLSDVIAMLQESSWLRSKCPLWFIKLLCDSRLLHLGLNHNCNQFEDRLSGDWMYMMANVLIESIPKSITFGCVAFQWLVTLLFDMSPQQIITDNPGLLMFLLKQLCVF